MFNAPKKALTVNDYGFFVRAILIVRVCCAGGVSNNFRLIYANSWRDAAIINTGTERGGLLTLVC